MSTLSFTGRLVRNALGAPAVAGAIAALAGCYTEGGPQQSLDRFTYVSRPHQPKTISVVDTRSYETIWTVDIPVGQKLALQFYPNKRVKEGEAADPLRPDVLRWQLIPESAYFGELHNEIGVPPSNSRRIEMKLRPGPEMPAPPPVVPPATPPAYMDDAREHPATTPAGTPTPAAPAETKPAEPPVELPK